MALEGPIDQLELAGAHHCWAPHLHCGQSAGGLVVHRDGCKNLADNRGNRQKQIELQWSQRVEGEFDVEIRLELENKRGMFALIAGEINEMQANIERISTTEKDSGYRTMELQLSVVNRDHLAHIMRRIHATNGVSKVVRAK